MRYESLKYKFKVMRKPTWNIVEVMAAMLMFVETLIILLLVWEKCSREQCYKENYKWRQ